LQTNIGQKAFVTLKEGSGYQGWPFQAASVGVSRLFHGF
jgi:hypothetical protein